jgi:hypothetical protein
MMSSPRIDDRYQICFTWLAARSVRARIHLLNSHAAGVAITPHNLQRAHLHRPVHPADRAKISLHPSCPHIVSITGVPKSP